MKKKSADLSVMADALLATKLLDGFARELRDPTIDHHRTEGCAAAITQIAARLREFATWSGREGGIKQERLEREAEAKLSRFAKQNHWLALDCIMALPPGASVPLFLGGARDDRSKI